MLVEDEESLRNLAKQILEMLGYQVTVASTGDAALETLGTMTSPVDLLLTDVIMPGISGPALARRMLESRPGLKVLYMSGYTDDAISHHGVLEEGVHLINKPFSPSALAKAVRNVLDGISKTVG